MATFVLGRNRDAWFVIRGYKYQVDLTILRWMSLADSEFLLLECGEDIDIVNRAIAGGDNQVNRQLEQVKHLDTPITLNTPVCKAALANAALHFATNPSHNLLFRFFTNTSITTERPSAFTDRKAGLDIWERLRSKAVSEPERTERLSDLLVFLGALEKPSEGVDKDTWKVFADFVTSASIDELDTFITRFEWSTRQSRAGDVSKDILLSLRTSGRASFDGAKAVYPRLFLHVMQLLAQPGEKRLDIGALDSLLALPTLSPSDTRLLRFLTTELLSQATRVEQIEQASQRHEEAIADIRNSLLEMKFGPPSSVNLSMAVADISTALPPQVDYIAKRTSAVDRLRSEALNCDWLAIYGSVGCGKTQLAALVGDHLKPLVYVSLRDLNPPEANFLLHHLFLQLCDERRTGSVTTSGLTALEHGATLLFDDVPRLLSDDQLSLRLIRIADSVPKRSQRLITFSHYPVPDSVIARLGSGRFCQMRAPRFDQYDVRDLLLHHGAPNEVVTEKLVELFLQKSSGHPTLIAAIARSLQATGWDRIDEQRYRTSTSASAVEVVQDATFRLLQTVESRESRQLLYRLCVVSGSFGAEEVNALSAVKPVLPRPAEAYSSLLGLWIEKLSENVSTVCPLIATFGANELEPEVERAVANTLAELLFNRAKLSPIEFAKAIGYLSRAKNGLSLGIRLLKGLESVADLPIAWKRIVFVLTNRDGLLKECPTTLALLIKARQLELAHSIDVPKQELISEANRLIEKAARDELWAVIGYAAQVAPLVANDDFREALRLGELVVNNIDDVIEYRNALDITSADSTDNFDIQFKSSFPWFLVSAIKNPTDFLQWFQFVTNQTKTQTRETFESDLAREGFKIALDQLWLIQHNIPNGDREWDSVLAAYEAVRAYSGSDDFRLFDALATRAQIVVWAEYLNDLGRAAKLADAFLETNANNAEVEFLINEVIGRQYLYAKKYPEAISHLTRACQLDTGTFDGLRCRAFLELSRAIGDEDSSKAAYLAREAVIIARRNPRDVPELDMVSALGEAAIAAAFEKEYVRSFEYMDEAFTLMSQSFSETIEWKMRWVYLGNALGYFSSVASTGEPPCKDYTVPPRGHLISYNEAAAKWYDDAEYEKFDLAPTLLVVFANAVGMRDRARFWANRGIDDARAKGVLACIYPLAEVLIPTVIAENKIDQALDYAYEAATALVASMVAHRSTMPDIRERQDAFQLLGTKPNNDWDQAEKLYLFIGVIPSIFFGCVHSLDELLDIVAADCSAKAANASSPTQFVAVSEAIAYSRTNVRSAELHSRALGEWQRGSFAGAAANYVLSSFAPDADVRLAIVQHAVVMHELASKIARRSLLWEFLAELLVTHWRATFEKERFRFSKPALVEDTLRDLEQAEPEKKIKRLIRTILDGLSVHLPAKLAVVSDWLRA